MASTYKNSQKQGTASLSTYDNLHNAVSGTAVISSIVIANTASVTKQFRLAITSTSSDPGPPPGANWIAYNSSIAANDTLALTLGLTMTVGQYLKFSSTDTNLSFSVYFSEIS